VAGTGQIARSHSEKAFKFCIAGKLLLPGE
jgi:hypothetical protein